MAKFRGAVKRCAVCEVGFKVPACRASTAICCSRKCKDAWWRTQRTKTLTFSCAGCGKEFTDYASHADRRVFCSRSCKAKNEDKPDICGSKNPRWNGGVVRHSDGYVYVSSQNHPFSSRGRYIFEHRLVVEKWLLGNDPNSRFLVFRDGKKYLDPKIIVHHRNEIKTDNDISNLECMTQGDHLKHHRNTAESLKQQIAVLQKRLKILEKEK